MVTIMGTVLNPPPVESDPGRPAISGDLADDDAQIMDDLIESQAEPPEPRQLPHSTKPVAESTSVPAPITRIMTTNLEVQSTWSAVLLLPKDANRTSLTLYAFSETPTNWIRWADDPGKLMQLSACAKLYSGQLLSFPGPTHTGPVWVYGPDLVTTACNVVAIAITS